MSDYYARRRLTIMLSAVIAIVGCLAVPGSALADRGNAAVASAAGFHAVTAAGSTTGIELDGSPGTPVADPGTHTVYVPIQCPQKFCAGGKQSSFVDVISTRHCSASQRSGCRVEARAKVGKYPQAIALDKDSGTLYVANGTGSVSVVSDAHCRAADTSSCHDKPVATLAADGKFLFAIAVDSRTKSLYVASPDGAILVYDVSRCDAHTTAGCHGPVAVIKDKRAPDGIDVDLRSNTIYAADDGANGDGDTVTVIDGRRCDAKDHKGCTRSLRTVRVGSGPFWLAVDQRTDSVYTPNFNDGTVSVIDGRDCNGSRHTACGHRARAISTGSEVSFVGVDPKLKTVFAVNAGDNTLSPIPTSMCNGHNPRCPAAAPALQAAPDQGRAFVNSPNAFALMPKTNSMYIVTDGGTPTMQVRGIDGCRAGRTSSCRQVAPTTSEPPAFFFTLDSSSGTIYASDTNKAAIDVLSAATCRSTNLAGCKPLATIPVADSYDFVGSVDDASHTLYVGDEQATDIQVINTSGCAVGDLSGCAHAVVATTPKGSSAATPVLNPSTSTLYSVVGEPASSHTSHIDVIDASTCNATVTTGCHQVAGRATVGAGASELAVNQTTDSIYVTNTGDEFSGNTVTMIGGTTCNAANVSGCAGTHPTVKTGTGPYGVTIDETTDTVYIADNADGDAPGQVSIVDGSTCQATVTTGCTRALTSVGVGRSPSLIALDPVTYRLLVTDHSSAGVSVFNTQTCNALDHTGCPAQARLIPVGSSPRCIVVDPATGTAYVGVGNTKPGLSILTPA